MAESRTDVFDGAILGIGWTSGVRTVIGVWPRSPLGPIADVMIEMPYGHRVLLAPTTAVADYIAATYTFDEVRVQPVHARRSGPAGRRWSVRTTDLDLDLDAGRRTALGVLLQVVPRELAVAPWWVGTLDPVARRVLRGVRTRGTAGGGRTEFYGALDQHRISGATGSLDGVSLGGPAPIDPPVRFGFGSVPPRPSVVRIVTTIRR
ncbi:hypothetical protein GIS00_07755 [Nakamurella sp. YIM 132087]|uniref:DUF2071 domain-containing protein n=1 Tax=Nakamurella alba TaxID=2665158 RepID=A0A7K1FLR5_9ACTN|nr:hypothetical protein [Nakamurella alba]MTD13834.1 hypothetical protein [Nakamurella alba]